MATANPGGELNRTLPDHNGQILSAVALELAASRAKRDAGQGARTLRRVFGLLLLLGLLAAGLGAMWYLQMVAEQQRPAHHSPAITAPAH